MEEIMIKATLTAAALGLTLSAAPAIAGDERPSTRVEYKDLNLTTPEGQEKLERRIDYAARTICGVGRVRTGTRIASSQSKECLKAAKQSAKQQVAAMIEREQRGG